MKKVDSYKVYSSKTAKRKFVVLASLLCFFAACIGSDRKDYLRYPAVVAIDSAQNRVFVIDQERNGLNLIDVSDNNKVITRENDKGDEVGLLTEDDALLLPPFVTNAAVANLGNGVSRLFIIGSESAPLQQLIVIDYDTAGGVKRPELSPVAVPGDPLDALVGIAVDHKRGVVWLTNADSGKLYGYDVQSVQEIPESPIAVAGRPTHLSIDPNSDHMAVANSDATQVSLIDLANPQNPALMLETGHASRDVALTSNGSGNLLFVTGLQDNRAQLYRFQFANIAQAELIAEQTPVNPNDTDPEIVTGNLNMVHAGALSDGRMAGFITQSSGDLLVMRVSSDLQNVTSTKIEIGAVSGEGIDALLDAQGVIQNIYFASPGVGTLTVVNPLEDEFDDQIP